MRLNGILVLFIHLIRIIFNGRHIFFITKVPQHIFSSNSNAWKAYGIFHLHIFFYIIVSKVKTQIGNTVNLSWTAAFFTLTGQYLVYYTYRENRTIFGISNSGVSYEGYTMSTKYTYLNRLFNSTNIMFEVRDITVGDAGYYNGGTCTGAAWSGGGVLLIVNGNLFLRFHTVGLNLSITIPNWNNTYIEPFQVYVLILSST